MVNEKEKKEYLEEYQKAKEKGVMFFPDILVKDAIVSLIVFIILTLLAYFVGAKLEARANPADTAYTPRPEWYFLFLFQLLKYFPGSLEVIGVVVVPLVVLVVLILFPYLDKSSKRHFLNRPIFAGLTAAGVGGIVALTLLAVFEAPPPTQAPSQNQAATLYLDNCSGCHGASIEVPENVNLHTIIAQGKHEGMPAWNADLSPDEIDALAGFILRPEGSQLFSSYCSECHQVTDLVESNPFDLKAALDEGPDYPPHANLDVPQWIDVLGPEGRTTLLNFLIAPDGQRLYTVYCSSCHGSPSFTLGEAELRETIEQGGQHLGMPAWKGQLSQDEIQSLAGYVVNPSSHPEAADLFAQNCSTCHSDVIPSAPDVNTAVDIITSGGPHRTMPIWGEVLTSDQLNALLNYILTASQQPAVEQGQQLFLANCSTCHGEFGEGGVNPARPGDIIPPISSAEYLDTRDDFTLRTIIAQGQPNFGMSPFSEANGGPLNDDEIDAIVAFLRSWEANPPVEMPPEIETSVLTMSAADIYTEICAQCHGLNGEGLTAPAINTPNFKQSNTAKDIYDSIALGNSGTEMIAWSGILSDAQIQDLVDYILALESVSQAPQPGAVSFNDDVLPILTKNCNFCHGELGGWDGTTYESVINSGDNGPVVIPGDVDKSLLAQKLLGTQTIGGIMPPTGKLSDATIQIILDWIEAGAPDN
jgi:mono/diheme cytochrome c family protein